MCEQTYKAFDSQIIQLKNIITELENRNKVLKDLLENAVKKAK
jgi:hypothetical protein